MDVDDKQQEAERNRVVRDDDPSQPDPDKKLSDADSNFARSREQMHQTGAMHHDTKEGLVRGAINPEHEGEIAE